LPTEGEATAGAPAPLESEIRFLAECMERRLDEYWSALDQSRRSLIAVRRLAEVCLDDTSGQPAKLR
jgi:hypothetical protein